jgi:hypothetical protein
VLELVAAAQFVQLGALAVQQEEAVGGAAVGVSAMRS